MLFSRTVTHLECTGRTGVTYKVTEGADGFTLEAERAGTVHRAVLRGFTGGRDAACALALALCEAGAPPEELERIAGSRLPDLVPV